MTRAAKADATYEDVLAAPPNTVAELLGGALYVQPRPAFPHSNAASVLGMTLGPPFHLGRGGPGGWWILFEPELHFGRDVLVPDLAAWRRDDHPEFDLTQAFATEPPNWVCEVLSPSTQGTDRVRKLPIYAAAGVEHAWLVDPLSRTLEVFAVRGGAWTMIATHEGSEGVRAAPFEAFEVPLGDLWIDEP